MLTLIYSVINTYLYIIAHRFVIGESVANILTQLIGLLTAKSKIQIYLLTRSVIYRSRFFCGEMLSVATFRP